MIFRKHAHLRIEPIAGRYVVFDLNRYFPHVLNRIAADILINSNGDTSVEKMAERICRTYDVTFDRALEDIQTIYRDFVQNEFVQQVE